MTYRFVLLFALAASVARADDLPPLDVFLEQRVVEELASDGTLLSRLGVALDVEVVGAQVIVSLVDPSTRRAVASTKLDSIAGDREAAVASVVQVAANLAAQLRIEPPPSAETADAVKQALREASEERARQRELEARYDDEAIRFGHLYSGTRYQFENGGDLKHALLPYRGDRRLTTGDFFREVERDDLAQVYQRRRKIGIGAMVGGGSVVLLATAYIYAKGIARFSDDCRLTDPSFNACNAAEQERNARNSAEASRHLKLGVGVAGAGLVAGLIGIAYVRFANPVSEHQMHGLADEHNAKLRKRLQLAPQITPDSAGFSVAGQF